VSDLVRRKRAESFLLQGNTYLAEDKGELALNSYKRAAKLYGELQDAKAHAMVLNNMGLLLARKEQYHRTLRCFQGALELFEKNANHLSVAEQWGNIGSVFRDMNRYDDALDCYRSALPIYQKLQHLEGVADQFTNIGYIHVMKKIPSRRWAGTERLFPSIGRLGAKKKPALQNRISIALRRTPRENCHEGPQACRGILQCVRVANDSEQVQSPCGTHRRWIRGPGL
jgi:tetratricopeptide (TPR) repeat protein